MNIGLLNSRSQRGLMRILVAVRDVELGAFLQREFDAEYFAVDLVMDGEQAKSLVQKRNYDAAILGLNLRRQDDLDILRDIRARNEQLPILMLTNRARPEDYARMLDLGADDLVLRPFAPTELPARVRALLHRGVHHAEPVLRVDDLELSCVEHSVARAGRKIALTPKEFALLEYLMRNAGRHVDVYKRQLQQQSGIGWARSIPNKFRGQIRHADDRQRQSLCRNAWRSCRLWAAKPGIRPSRGDRKCHQMVAGRTVGDRFVDVGQSRPDSAEEHPSSS